MCLRVWLGYGGPIVVWSVVVNASQSVVGLWRSYSGMVCSGECVSECGWVMEVLKWYGV